MEILLSTRWTYTPGPEVTFNCPKCGRQGASAHTRQTHEANSLFWVIPLFTTTYTTVTCGTCGQSFCLFKSLDDVTHLPADTLSQLLETSVPFLIKFCIVCSLALFIIPFVGLLFGIIGLAATIKKKSGWKKVAMVGCALSLLPVLALILALVLG